MNNNTKSAQTAYAHWMDSVPGLGLRGCMKLLIECEAPKAVYELSEKELEELVNGKIITIEQKEALITWKKKYEPEILMENLGQKGIRCIYQEETAYPDKLRNIDLPPLNLYVKGALPNPEYPSIGIVGARMCSEYGRYLARKYGEYMAMQGIQVISGMALGIDGIAQNAALDKGGTSYGILGCGIDICYPDGNRNLYQRLSVSGGVISEYIPGTQPKSGLFPMRNRIISGLSDALLVIEARERSGSLITVDRALEQGKEVYAVPGRVVDALSSGCNRLIQQGANMALSPAGVAEAIWQSFDAGQNRKHRCKNENESGDDSVQIQQEQKKLHNLSREEAFVYAVLTDTPTTVDEIYCRIIRKKDKNAITMPELYTILMNLKLKGCVETDGGRYYIPLA